MIVIGSPLCDNDGESYLQCSHGVDIYEQRLLPLGLCSQWKYSMSINSVVQMKFGDICKELQPKVREKLKQLRKGTMMIQQHPSILCQRKILSWIISPARLLTGEVMATETSLRWVLKLIYMFFTIGTMWRRSQLRLSYSDHWSPRLEWLVESQYWQKVIANGSWPWSLGKNTVKRITIFETNQSKQLKPQQQAHWHW